jgi:hypothetical protein
VVAEFGDALEAVFGAMADALANDQVRERLEGPPAHQGFGRLV